MTESELNDLLRDWGLHGDFDQTFESWQVWRTHHVLPYSGGWLEQPWWVRQDFATLNAALAWHELQAEKADAPETNPFAE